jgi:hypothetical protein
MTQPGMDLELYAMMEEHVRETLTRPRLERRAHEDRILAAARAENAAARRARPAPARRGIVPACVRALLNALAVARGRRRRVAG